MGLGVFVRCSVWNFSWHAKWATSTANHRTRATLQMFKYVTGELPRLPETAVEIYGKLVNQPTLNALSCRHELTTVNASMHWLI